MEHSLMIWIQLLFLIPILISAFMAVRVKYRKGKKGESRLLMVIAMILLLNGGLMILQLHYLDLFLLKGWPSFLQMILGCLVIPVTYLFFYQQFRHNWVSRISIITLVPILALLLPNLVICIGTGIAPVEVMPRCLNVVVDGVLKYSVTLDVFIAAFQCAVCAFAVSMFSIQMNKLGLKYTRDFKIFLVWVFVCMVFLASTYVLPWSFWQRPFSIWMFVVLYSFIGSFGLWVIYSQKGDSPLVTEDDSEQVVLSDFIQKNSDLAFRARQILDYEKMYLKPGLVIDDMVETLGTNRTYFTRMMKIEFGQTFNEYVNSQRVKYSMELLLSTDKNLNEIAEESGFSNASAYCRVFKRLMDTSPESWKAANQKH